MPFPSPPEIQTSYTAQEQALGDGTLPGQELDVDLASIRASVTAIIEFLKTSLRSDGRLANGSVSQDTLASSILIGFDPPAPWETGQAYTTRSTVFEGFGFYLCTVAHTSGTFSTDLASGRWVLLADLTPPGGALIASNDLSDLPDVGNARSNLGLGSMATASSGTGADQHRTNIQNEAVFQAISAVLTSWAAITRASGFDTFVATPSSANLRALMTDESGSGALLFAGGAMGTPSSLVLTNATGLTTAGIAAATLVTAADTLASNDNDTTIPTSAAVIDHVAANSSRVLLASKTASSSATLDFTEFNNALYSRYVFEIDEILPATDNVSFRCRFSSNGGSSYDAGGTDYVFIAEDYVGAGSGNGDGASGQSYIEITRLNATSNSAALDGICCEAHLVSAGNASVRTKIYGNGGFMLGGTSPAAMRFYGQRAANQDTDAVRFFFSSGNIASGRIRLYGIA